MEYNKRYTISEMRAILGESTSEFKPKFGPGVEAANGRNNGKAVGDIMDDTARLEAAAKGELEKGRTAPPQDAKDFNKTTLDYQFRTEPADSYKGRVKAQVHGYPSADNEKNSNIEEENEGLGFEGNKDFYDSHKEQSGEVSDEETKLRHSGLAARTYPEEKFKKETLFKESRKMKRLHYKSTKFLSENQIRGLIPEEYKKDGNKFLMRDCAGEEYMIECRNNPAIDFLEVTIDRHVTDKELNENLERMRELAGYDSREETDIRRTAGAMSIRESLDRMKEIEGEFANGGKK